MKAIDESKFDEAGNYLPDLPAGAWAVYVAHFPSPFGLFVKVGISETPVTRLWGVHCNSPFPLERFTWSWVRCKATAVAAERTMREAHEAERTRGEWYRFDLPGEEVDSRIHGVLAGLETARCKFNWKPGALRDVLDHVQDRQRAKLAALERVNARRTTKTEPTRRLWRKS